MTNGLMAQKIHDLETRLAELEQDTQHSPDIAGVRALRSYLQRRASYAHIVRMPPSERAEAIDALSSPHADEMFSVMTWQELRDATRGLDGDVRERCTARARPAVVRMLEAMTGPVTKWVEVNSPTIYIPDCQLTPAQYREILGLRDSAATSRLRPPLSEQDLSAAEQHPAAYRKLLESLRLISPLKHNPHPQFMRADTFAAYRAACPDIERAIERGLMTITELDEATSRAYAFEWGRV